MKTLRKQIKRTFLFVSVLLLLGSNGILAADKPTDKQISNAVDNELMFNTSTPAYLIDVNTHDGIVTLSGSVNNLLAKDRAVKIARTVKGVRAVVNEISVDAPYRTDETLKTEVKESLMNDPATDSYEISVTASNGKVNLSGTVESWQEKKLSEFVAMGVEGVKDVENNIAVKYKYSRSDFEILEDIKGAMENDVRVDNALIAVNVENGDVTLSGIAGSANERYLATADAWVTGVKSVNNDDLKVDKWARDDNLRKDKYAARTDEQVKNAVEDAFTYDPRVYSFNPEVSVNNGVVTLTGSVDNLRAKQAADQDAKNVVGVTGVYNRLKVRPIYIPEDLKLENEVSSALQKDPTIDKWKIDATADNGIVYLNGSVDSYFEKTQAASDAARIKGVVAVENNIQVNDLNERYFSGYYGWNSYYPPYHVDVSDTYQTDAQIANNIESQLWWSPYVNRDDVEVTVSNGEADLEGTVDTEREKLYAEINAYEGGADKVDNNLVVINTQ